MRIGEVAARAGVPSATVRYYERRGLIAKPLRSAGGYRNYGVEAVERLRFIKRAQELGFTLEEIHQLLALRVEDPGSCAVVGEKTREKIDQVRGKIRRLERLEEVLVRLAASCDARAATHECPVLEILLDEVSSA